MMTLAMNIPEKYMGGTPQPLLGYLKMSPQTRYRLMNSA